MKHKLDRTDIAILRQLQNDARLSNKVLAARVKIAPSTCLERVRRLQEAGVIIGYHAEIKPEQAGIGVQALVAVQLRQHIRPIVESFQQHALALQEVVQLFHTTGTYDFLLHVAVRDTAHLRSLVLSAFTEREEVDRIETSLLFAHRTSNTLPLYPDIADL